VTRCGYTFFATPLGACGLAWGARGIVLVVLPEASEGAVRARLRRRLPGASEAPPPPEVRRARAGILALLRGEPVDLADVVLDTGRVPPFDGRVYEVARTIPAGETRGYGEIAARLGDPAWARAVGRALARNPFPLVVPCHRVLAAGGRIGGFSAPGGVAIKRRLLAIESGRAGRQPKLFDVADRAPGAVVSPGRAS
jgi:methylated-DNA-[protein]-cysteine S-methyltransferase